MEALPCVWPSWPACDFMSMVRPTVPSNDWHLRRGLHGVRGRRGHGTGASPGKPAAAGRASSRRRAPSARGAGRRRRSMRSSPRRSKAHGQPGRNGWSGSVWAGGWSACCVRECSLAGLERREHSWLYRTTATLALTTVSRSRGELAIDWKVWLFPMMRRTRGAYRPGSRNRAFEPHFGAIACREVTKIIQERPLPPPRLLTQIW